MKSDGQRRGHESARSRLALLMPLLVLGVQACVDTEARYHAFLDRSADMRGLDAGSLVAGDRFDWSGPYLLALSTVLGPDTPLLFAVDATVASDLSRAELHFQPLTTDTDQEPRTAIGDSFSVKDVPYAADGSFNADLGEVTVPARANPISGAEIVANVHLIASTRRGTQERPNDFCGQASGMVTVPLAFDLSGSTFGAVLAKSAQAAKPLLRCP